MMALSRNAVIGREIELYGAHLSNFGRGMMEKFNTVSGTLESAAWLVLALSLTSIIAFMVIRYRRLMGSDQSVVSSQPVQI